MTRNKVSRLWSSKETLLIASDQKAKKALLVYLEIAGSKTTGRLFCDKQMFRSKSGEQYAQEQSNLTEVNADEVVYIIDV